MCVEEVRCESHTVTKHYFGKTLFTFLSHFNDLSCSPHRKIVTFHLFLSFDLLLCLIESSYLFLGVIACSHYVLNHSHNLCSQSFSPLATLVLGDYRHCETSHGDDNKIGSCKDCKSTAFDPRAVH